MAVCAQRMPLVVPAAFSAHPQPFLSMGVQTSLPLQLPPCPPQLSTLESHYFSPLKILQALLEKEGWIFIS